jgi:hypothetical protein
MEAVQIRAQWRAFLMNDVELTGSATVVLVKQQHIFHIAF